MKSRRPENVLDTSCKDCTFAVYKDNTQVSCFDAQRLEAFKSEGVAQEAYDNDKEFYVIHRFCNIYRNKDSVDLEKELELALDENAVTFKIFLDCSDIPTGMDLDKIANHLQYSSKKYRTAIIYGGDLNSDQRHDLILLSNKLKCDITKYLEYNDALHNKVKISSDSFHAIFKINDLPEPSILKKINNFINREMGKAVVINVNGIEFISNLAYHMKFLEDENCSYSVNVQNIVKEAQSKTLYKCL